MNVEMQELLKFDDKSTTEKINGAKKHCFTCGGNGFVDKICPECGMQPTSISMNLDKKPAMSKNLLEEVKAIRVPASYAGVVWNREILESTHMEHKDEPMFNRYVEQLSRIHKIFMTGAVPAKSAIIIAPPQFSKVTFAYSCMQSAIEHGHTVAPLLDSLEVKRLIVLAAETPTKQYDSIDYNEYINSEVVFITITKTAYREEAYQIIEEILDKRSRRNLPTFFISRYNLATLSKRDWGKSFEFIKDYNNTENSLKYPAIINFWFKQAGTTKGV